MSKESALAMLTGQAPPAPAAESTPPSTPAPSPPSEEQSASSELKSTPFSHLAKKEAEIQKQREEFKREREELVKEKETLMKVKAQYDEYQEKKKSDPVAALKMLGFSETDIFNYMAAQQPQELTPEQKAAQAAEQAAAAKIKEFEENQAKKEREAQQATDKRLIDGYRSEISKAISSNKDQFEYCSYYGPEAEALAYEIALAVVKESNGSDIITADEAVKMAEEYFEQKDQEMMHIKKRQPKAPEAPPAQPTQAQRTRTVTPGNPNAPQPNPTVQKSRTLSNAATSTSTVASARVTRNETREQKRERLIEALKNGTVL